MSETAALRSHRHEDGTVEVWIDGWHLTFTTDGEAPTEERAPAPARVPEPAADVTATGSAGRRVLRVAGWIVAVAGGDVIAVPATPDMPAGDRPVVYRHMTR